MAEKKTVLNILVGIRMPRFALNDNGVLVFNYS